MTDRVAFFVSLSSEPSSPTDTAAAAVRGLAGESVWLEHSAAVEHAELAGRGVHVWWRCRFVDDSEALIDGVATALDRNSVDPLSDIEGDFVAVAWNMRTDQIIAVRSRLNPMALYLHHQDGRLVVSDSGAELSQVAGVSPSLDARWAASYVACQPPDPTDTPLRDIRRLPSGGAYLGTRRGPADFSELDWGTGPPTVDAMSHKWLDEYRRELWQSVGQRISLPGVHAFEQSAGLDSSSLSAVAADIDPELLRTAHAVGFGKWGTSESAAIRLAADLGFGRAHVVFSRSLRQSAPNVHLDESFKVLGWPSEHPDVMSYQPLWELCRDLGVSVLHSGYGGDQGVSFPARSGPAQVIDELGRVRGAQALGLTTKPRLLAGARRMALQEARQATGRFSVERSLASPEAVMLISNCAGVGPALDHPTSVDDLVRNYTLGVSLQLRIEHTYTMAASYGLEYTYPLLAPRLVQSYLRSPALWKWHGGFDRYLHRRAVAEILPAEVAWGAKDPMFRQRPQRQQRAPSTDANRIALARLYELQLSPHKEVTDLLDQSRVADEIHQLRSGHATIPSVAIRRAFELNHWLQTR